MKTQLIRLLIALALCASLRQAAAQGTAFAYQGQLVSSGSPANGLYDFQFSLSNAPSGGSQIGETVTNLAVGVTNGLFTTSLDFGAVFTGNATWLAMSVRTNGTGSYVGLTPLQQLTPTPYAIFANSASNVSGTLPAAQLSGQVGNNQLVNNSITVTAGAGLTGGGVVALGGATTLNNAGVVSVTGNADITATTTGGVVTLGDTATNANLANTIVKRDGSGNFTNSSHTLTGNLNLPLATDSAGIITGAIFSGTNTLIFAQAGSFGTAYGSFFAGSGAGNLTNSGSLDNTGVGAQALSMAYGGENSAVGYQALQDNGYGNNNSAFGFQALSANTTGSENTAIGSQTLFYQGLGTSGVGNYNTALGCQALYHNLNGSWNTASGYLALWENTAGYYNTASGYQSLYNNTSGYYNTASGYGALSDNTSGSANTADGVNALSYSTTCNSNTAAGYQALYSDKTGSYNLAEGVNALFSNTVGSNNIALGYAAGYNLTNSFNIDIGNPGVAADTNIIRIGAGQSQAFIAGVITGNGSGLTNVNASQVGGVATSNLWQTTGNAGTAPGVNFLGTSDNQPLIFEADNHVGLQLQYVSSTFGLNSQSGINLIGGFGANTISNGVIGGTIAGGGYYYRAGLLGSGNVVNVVTANLGTVGGGAGNTAGYFGTVPGGSGNSATGYYATVPGGYDDLAGGDYSLAAGQQAQATNQGAFVWADSQNAPFASTSNDQFLIRAQGGVGIGTNNPNGNALSVNGNTWFNGNNWVDGNIAVSGNTSVSGALASTSVNVDPSGSFGQNSGTIISNALTFGTGSGGSGEGIASKRVGSNPFDLEFYTGFNNRMTILNNGNVGIGMTNPSTTLDVNGEFMAIEGVSGVRGYLGDDGTGKGVEVGSLTSGVTVVSCFNQAENAYMDLTCSSITIKGGADLAEPFPITSADQPVSEGAVVVIDKKHPGRLKLSDQPYDPHVAGVVSGANGIHPGIQMQQQGLLEGGKNVALTGRVYVQADTSNGAIEPGDLLTTSSTPGRAMKVSDHLRAQGAILGKAMTALDAGQGMVLVLVTLQ